MSEKLDALLRSLAARPTDTRLDAIGPRVWARIDERRRPWDAAWRWRLSLAVFMLALGLFAANETGLTRPHAEAFALNLAYAPSNLLASER
jgi:hypothetical protein